MSDASTGSQVDGVSALGALWENLDRRYDSRDFMVPLEKVRRDL